MLRIACTRGRSNRTAGMVAGRTTTSLRPLQKMNNIYGAAGRWSYRPATQIPSVHLGRPHHVNRGSVQAQEM